MEAFLGTSIALGHLGRGSFGAVFLASGVAALILGIVFWRESWFLAAIAIPGAAAGFVGTVVWMSRDVSLRWLLIAAPLASATVFARRGHGGAQASAAALTSAAMAIALFIPGAGAAFLAALSD